MTTSPPTGPRQRAARRRPPRTSRASLRDGPVVHRPRGPLHGRRGGYPPVSRPRDRAALRGLRARGGAAGAPASGWCTSTMTRWCWSMPGRCCPAAGEDGDRLHRRRPARGPPGRSWSRQAASWTSGSRSRSCCWESCRASPGPGRPWRDHRPAHGRRAAGQLPGHLAVRRATLPLQRWPRRCSGTTRRPLSPSRRARRLRSDVLRGPGTDRAAPRHRAGTPVAARRRNRGRGQRSQPRHLRRGRAETLMHRRPQRDRCPAGRRRARDAFITAALCVTIGGEGQQPALRLLSDRILPAGRFSGLSPRLPGRHVPDPSPQADLHRVQRDVHGRTERRDGCPAGSRVRSRHHDCLAVRRGNRAAGTCPPTVRRAVTSVPARRPGRRRAGRG